jgi:hypothetical protein
VPNERWTGCWIAMRVVSCANGRTTALEGIWEGDGGIDQERG